MKISKLTTKDLLTKRYKGELPMAFISVGKKIELNSSMRLILNENFETTDLMPLKVNKFLEEMKNGAVVNCSQGDYRVILKAMDKNEKILMLISIDDEVGLKNKNNDLAKNPLSLLKGFFNRNSFLFQYLNIKCDILNDQVDMVDVYDQSNVIQIVEKLFTGLDRCTLDNFKNSYCTMNLGTLDNGYVAQVGLTFYLKDLSVSKLLSSSDKSKNHLIFFNSSLGFLRYKTDIFNIFNKDGVAGVRFIIYFSYQEELMDQKEIQLEGVPEHPLSQKHESLGENIKEIKAEVKESFKKEPQEKSDFSPILPPLPY